MPEPLMAVWSWLAGLPGPSKVLLSVATSMVVVELLLRRLAPRSVAYARWTRFFLGLGHVWTAVILGLVYFVTVSLVSLGMRLSGKDQLDRRLDPEPTFWRPHESNPLGMRAAARHQF